MQAERGSGEPVFSDCELCAASQADDGAADTGGTEAARHLLVTGLLRQYYLAQQTCPVGVAEELFRLLSSSADPQVTMGAHAACCSGYSTRNDARRSPLTRRVAMAREVSQSNRQRHIAAVRCSLETGHPLPFTLEYACTGRDGRIHDVHSPARLASKAARCGV